MGHRGHSSLATSLASTLFGKRLEDPASLPTFSSPKPCSTSTLANTDFVERGRIYSSILEKMNRNGAFKRKSNRSSLPTESEKDIMEESSSTSVERYEEMDITIEGLSQLTNQGKP
jgi:hypothetical protein